MHKLTANRVLVVVIAVFSLSLMVGCAGMERRSPNRSAGYLYYHAPLVKADQALDEARMAGKDKECPAEFNALKDKVDEAYKVYMACHTQEAIYMAQEATGKIKALCPAGPVTDAKPRAEEQVLILVSEPKAEEKVIVLASEPKIEKRTIILALEDVHFDFDKSTLTKEAQVILKRSITRLKENPKANIRIAGYASASGTKEYNQKLSERRATAVYDYITKEGLVPPEKLTTIGYGEMKPATYEPIPEDIYSEAAKTNMRVLFEVVVK